MIFLTIWVNSDGFVRKYINFQKKEKKMKNLKKILCVALSAIAITATAFTGCSPDENEVKVDNTKTQLYISNFNGGYGSEWLEEIIERFCAENAETEFESGKKGVQVWVEKHKESGVSLSSKMSGSRNEIYFMEQANYYDMATRGLLLDISDMATEKLTAYGENVSIEEKLDENVKDYFKTPQGKYYALPHYLSSAVLTCDLDVFDEKKLFRGKDGVIGYKSTDKELLSEGPDGISGTSDDGFPATYEEFYELCGVMRQCGIDPMAWSGLYKFYSTWLVAQMKADFEGEEAPYSYTFNGKATKLVESINSDGSINYQPETEITEANGYKMFASAGTYYAYDFMYNIVKNQYYYSKSFNDSLSHTDVQSHFLYSRYDKRVTGGKTIGMLVEGTWWVNEAEPTFRAMSSYKDSSLEKRRLAVMPFPKATKAQIGEQQTLMELTRTLCCINANISQEKIPLAKKFLQYCMTNKSLVESFKLTNVRRSYKMDISGEYDNLSPYAKSVVDTLNNSRIVIPTSSSEFYYKNSSAFIPDEIVATKSEPHPAWAFWSGRKTSKTLFEDICSKYNQITWNVLLGK